MSEPEQEPTPTEPVKPTEPDIPPEEPEPEPEPEPTPEPQPEPEPTGARDDVEIDAIYTKIEKRAGNYVKSISEILDGAGVPVTICEMCADAYPGVRWVEPRDEMHAALASVVGAHSGESPLELDPDAELCERCKGFGALKLPGHVPNQGMRQCKLCNGVGWRERNPQSGALQPPTVAADNGETELLPGVPPDDPSVVDLRSRGYTVIPPMQIAEQV